MEYICLKRKNEFKIEAKNYLNIFQETLQLKTITSVEFIIFYEIANASLKEINLLKKQLFINDVRDEEVVFQSWQNHPYIAVKPLPLQFDNRSDSATQISIILTKNSQIKISAGIILVLNKEASIQEVQEIKKYLINPLESYEYNFQSKNFASKLFVNKVIENFQNLSSQELLNLINQYQLSLALEDLKFIQNHYQIIGKNINILELQLFNTYWSDHCRHTTFNTIFDKVHFPHKLNNVDQVIFDTYSSLVADMDKYMSDKPLTLMNMSKVNAISLKDSSYIKDNVEQSDEINACSIGFQVAQEKYYLNFKNETHNHPTEISPHGGAATCLGGAIRDILANRAYAFAGIRISGNGNILENINDTLANKLPQSIIAKEASNGFSSYGNQIGMPTAFVHEYYHPGYSAKHMECGAVLGLSSQKHLNKSEPLFNDLIILFGGDTGIDGIGGASGSSKEHNKNSINLNAEVQNGNPIIEKKIQRLLRKNPNFAKLMKRCNDFGAGGASVAIGEIADSVEINLDKFQTKYLNISPYEILFSESQERMAAVINPQDLTKFIKYCHEENLKAYVVGKVTNNHSIVAKYFDQVIIDVDKKFLDSGGSKKSLELTISSQKVLPNIQNPFSKNSFLKEQALLQNTFIKGLVEKFDSSIGSTAILNPYGGKYLLTKEHIPLVAIPDIDHNKHNLAAIISTGFALKMEKYPFYLGYYSVVEAISKIVARGGEISKTYLSFQEYFPKAKTNQHWEAMFLTILGAYKAMKEFGIAAIGGKDSVSGTYENIEIPNTFIAFAFTIANISNPISNTLQEGNTKLYLVNLYKNAEGFLDYAKNQKIYSQIFQWINNKDIIYCDVISENSILSTLTNSALGNMQNFNLDYVDVFTNNIGSLIIQTTKAIYAEFLILIGSTSLNSQISEVKNKFSINLLDIIKNQVSVLDKHNLYLPYANKANYEISPIFKAANNQAFKNLHKKECNVLIAIFPGTNCEFDLGNKFKLAGAKINYFVFNDLDVDHIQESINNLALMIHECDILAIPGGFSAADEPDGSGKYIASILNENQIRKSIQNHLANKKLILGICNGFQALVMAKLLPGISNVDITLSKNAINRHVSTIATYKTISCNSPWLNKKYLNTYANIPISNGEGNFYVSKSDYQKLIANGQIFSIYDNPLKMPLKNKEAINLTNSKYAIEGIISQDGLILGRMGHSERIYDYLYKNINFIDGDDIFVNAIKYIISK